MAIVLPYLPRVAALALLIPIVAGCEGPLVPEPEALQLTCPADVAVQTDSPSPVPVSYAAPVAQGGVPPYQTACTPGSGTSFPVGQTTVQCTTGDTRPVTASCTFRVGVSVPAKLTKTRFTAFGDSITEGVVSPAATMLMRVPLDAYPNELQARLSERYPRQEVIVFNRGLAGERLSQGVVRLPGVLDADRPEVLLLLEGVNNIRNEPLSSLFANMAAMVDLARGRGVDVILARLLPISADREARPGNIGTLAAIQALNVEIDRIAATRGLGPPVDLYTLFVTNPHLLGIDGLHPTEEGYLRIADAWTEAIVSRYHAPGAP